jgi:hypothetical protein
MQGDLFFRAINQSAAFAAKLSRMIVSIVTTRKTEYNVGQL